MIVSMNAVMLSAVLCLAHSNGHKGTLFVQASSSSGSTTSSTTSSSSSSASNLNGEEVISLDLEPASSLLHQHSHSQSHSPDAKEHGRRLSGRDGSSTADADADTSDNDTDTDSNASAEAHAPLLMPSMHPYNSAVYSSLVELEIMDDADAAATSTSGSAGLRRRLLVEEHNRSLQEFNKLRHLSRYEREQTDINTVPQRSNNNSNDNANANANDNDNDDPQRHRHLEKVDGFQPGSEVLDGGLYNEFQSVPLAQGYGTHYVTLWAGTPTPQRKTLIVDTGSHHTAFPCKGCKRCGEHHHTDKYFDPSISKTFRPLTCRECLWGATCEAVVIPGSTDGSDGDALGLPIDAQGCMFQQAYTEGSSWKAFQVQDTVFVGGKDVFSAADPIATRYSVDFTFGCQTFSSGLFVSQLADGIMGLSQHDATLPRAMYNQGKLRNRIFGLCFRTEMVVSKKGISAGVMTLGGIDRRLDSTPMVWARNLARTGWFTVYVKKLYLRPGGGSSAQIDHPELIIPITADLFSVNSGKGVILDSGTTDTYLHKSLAQPFNEAWKKITGKPYSNLPVKLTRQQIAELPTILIQLVPYETGYDEVLGLPDDIIGLVGNKLDENSPTDVLIAVPATHYMEYSPSKNVYTSRFYFTEVSY